MNNKDVGNLHSIGVNHLFLWVSTSETGLTIFCASGHRHLESKETAAGRFSCVNGCPYDIEKERERESVREREVEIHIYIYSVHVCAYKFKYIYIWYPPKTYISSKFHRIYTVFLSMLDSKT